MSSSFEQRKEFLHNVKSLRVLLTFKRSATCLTTSFGARDSSDGKNDVNFLSFEKKGVQENPKKGTKFEFCGGFVVFEQFTHLNKFFAY